MPDPRSLHLEATQDALDHALRESPLYGKRGLPPRGPNGSLEALAADVRRRLTALPALTKADLRTHFPRGFADKEALRAALAAGDCEVVGTSGTTADRVEVLWDRGWWDRQERAAMRISAAAAAAMDEGAREGGYREAVLTTPVCGAVCHIGDLTMQERTDGGILFLNQTADPSHFSDRDLERMLAELAEFRPHGLEADPAYLAALCRYTAARGRTSYAPRFVTLTYELISALHLGAIRAALPGTPLLPLYGSTETGVLFMACDQGRLHHSDAWSYVELVPMAADAAERRKPGAPPLHRVLVTTLGRKWMPLVRYDLGDLATVETAPCPCGRGGLMLRRVEGRSADLLDDTAGRVVTPAEVDDALAVVTGLAAYQVTQDGPGEATVCYVAEAESDPRAAVDAAAHGLFGPDARVTLVRDSAILPEPSGKYRISKRFAPLPVATLFPAQAKGGPA